MNRIHTLLLSLLVSLTVFSQGIVFETGTWKDILAKSEKSGKPIFVDVFTTWCGPCKMMSEQIFPKENVGKAYNEAFICYQLDAEKGDGLSVAAKYGVNSYPRFLFIRPNGKLFAQNGGSMFASDFIALSKLTLSVFQDGRSLNEVEKAYTKYPNNPSILLDLMRFRRANNLSNAEQFDTYLKLLPEQERTSDAVAELYTNEKKSVSVRSFACENLLKNKVALNSKLNGRVEFYLKDIAISSMADAALNYNEALLDQAIAVYGEDPPTPLHYLKAFFYMDYYITSADTKKFAEYARIYYNDFLMKLDPKTSGMNGAVMAVLIQKGTQYVLRKSMDIDLLNEAIAWSKRGEEVNPNDKMSSFITYSLMYKSGRNVEAKQLLGALIQGYKNYSDPNLKTFKLALQKMYNNEPMW
jgi:thiol-disulfide isomerase/thioredoxin